MSVCINLNRLKGLTFMIWGFQILKDDAVKVLAVLYMPASLENSAVATGLEKISFHSNPKEGQYQRMFKLPHNCTHLTC